MPEERFTVFVSSTYLDNVKRRDRVRAAIEQAGMAAIGMERFAAQARPALEVCLEEARRADLLLCILAHRYGSCPPGETRSFTELEFDANEHHIVFLIHPDLPRHEHDYDPGPDDERWEKQKLLARFKQRVLGNGQHCVHFDEESLQADVLHALKTWMAAQAPRGVAESTTPAAAADPGLLWTRSDCPFPGLGAYDEDRARLYAGREAEVDEVGQELARRLGPARGADLRWIQIEGASGAGKSSFVRAGLVPRLRTWSEEGSLGRFRIAVLRPRDEPLHSLALALARAFPGQTTEALEGRLREHPRALQLLLREQLDEHGEHLVLVIDQLEELFTYAPDEEEAPELAARHAAELAALSDNLAYALSGVPPARAGTQEPLAGAPTPLGRPAPLVLVTTIRRDYLGELAQLDGLDALSNRAHRRVLRPMDVRALEAAVRRPAEAAGLAWSPEGLPERIARETASDPRGLALLGHALEALWKRRSGKAMTEKAYDLLGGVTGALARQAAQLCEWVAKQSHRGKDPRGAVRSALLALVRVEADGRATRKVLPRAQLLAATGLARPNAEWLLTVLSGQRVPELQDDAPAPPRLVVVDGEGESARVEIVHEHLLVSWRAAGPDEPQGLADWIGEERERLLVRERFEAHAREWRAAGAPLLAVDSRHLYRRYKDAGSHDPDALAYLRAARKKQWLGRGVLAAAVLVLGVLGVLWWQGVRQERFDAELQYRLEMVRNWREPLLPRRAGGRLVAGDLDAFADLARALSPSYLGKVEERRADLQRRQDLNQIHPRDKHTLDVSAQLSDAASRLRQWLDEVEPSPLAPEGRDELRRRWEALRALGELAPPHARYDLLPLEQEGLPRPQFLVLGSGRPPDWNDQHQRWSFGPETGVVVAYLPGGTFLMGSPPGTGDDDERTEGGEQRTTTVSGFYLHVTEWTEGHESRLAPGAGGLEPSPLPLWLVDWNDASARAASIAGRLPTEAEWEYACRAGSAGPWTHVAAGDDFEDEVSVQLEKQLEEYAWFSANSERERHIVATRRANAWGLHDMHGNLSEWCSDWYGIYGPVVRGGSFGKGAELCRSACRSYGVPWDRFVNRGFRVALPAEH